MPTMVFFTRHAESCANINRDYPLDLFHNSLLSPQGIEDVVLNRVNKLNKIGHYDFIMTSPLTRSIQTCLMTHNITKVNGNIFVLPLLTEFDKYPDCNGDFIDIMKRNTNIIMYKNSDKLDYDSFFWDFNPNKKGGNWWNYEWRYNLHERINNFKKLINNPMFEDKTILVYTHSGFISQTFGQGVHNYHTIKSIFDGKTFTIVDIFK
jgi:broad specificity phosphatase PhoE